jgi:hypothetical protein
VNSLAGIISGSDGRFRYFALGWNHHIAASGATALIDSIVQAIADF